MTEFFNVLPPEEARQLLFRHVGAALPAERVQVRASLGRVTAESLRAQEALPAFRRSTMDGYAVRAIDTHGASDSLPALLTVVGEIPMGREAPALSSPGEALSLHTGGMIPLGADAVVQVEHTQAIVSEGQPRPPFEIEVYRPVAAGQNVLEVGEDVSSGDEILPAGHYVRPQDIGALMALGVQDVQVRRRPRVAIVATGDEVVEPSRAPGPGQVRDINSYTVAAQTEQAGGVAIATGIVTDDFDALRAAASLALADADMLVISAGSSVSVRDMSVRVIESLGQPGVLLHGVATRPGKPTIVGVANAKPILGLPGNPVSAMVQFAMFGVPAIYWLQGLRRPPQKGIVWARVGQNVPSESGREDYVPARLVETEEGLEAVPVFGKSNLIFTLVNADGLIKVPLNSSGVAAGEWVAVQLF
jgi:molybdopterin molybdotransferase